MTAIVIGAALMLIVLMVRPAIAAPGRVAGHFALAQAIATAEGYGVPNAIPTVRNNPGDLKLNGLTITTFKTPAEGWEALHRQLDLIVSGGSAHYTLDMTIAEMAATWTTTEQTAWAANVVATLRAAGWTVTIMTSLREVLT